MGRPVSLRTQATGNDIPYPTQRSSSPAAPACSVQRRRRTAWMMTVSACVMLIAFALPSIASARGRRTVPDLRNPRKTRVMPQPNAISVGLTVHVASHEGMPIAERRQVARWVARANKALLPHGLQVHVERVVPLSGFTAVTQRRQRRQLAEMAHHDGTIHVFVTNDLDGRSPPARGRRVRGLHWRYHGLRRALRQREYVVVTLDAPQTTFAHEIGHLMGLRHSLSENNIMCSCRRTDNTWFTAEQGATMRAGAQRYRTRQAQAQAREREYQSRYVQRARRRRW